MEVRSQPQPQDDTRRVMWIDADRVLYAGLLGKPSLRVLGAHVTYAGLDATLRAFTSGRAAADVPVMRMLAMPLDVIAARAEDLVTRLQSAGVPCDGAAGASTVGGGSLPGETLTTRLVRVESTSPDRLLAALRQGRTVVVARIADDRVCLDPRTVAEDDDDALAAAVGIAMQA